MRSEYRRDCRSNLVDVECGNASEYLRIAPWYVVSQAGRKLRPTTGYWNYYSLALHLFLFHLVVLTLATRLNDESKGPQADLCAPGLVSLPILQRVVAW